MRKASAVFAMIGLATVLAGCVGRPEGVLTPVAAATLSPSAASVRMLVATSRKPSGNPATLFTGERSPLVSMTDIEVSIPPNRASGTVGWPSRLPANPAKDFAVIRADGLASIADARGWLHQRKHGGHVLVFVHGFNNKYEDSVFRFAQIVHDSGADVVPILFTWPSQASVFGYNYDKESTNFSRSALEEGLRELVNDKSVKDITVLAHSMGTWLAMESLRQMAIRHGAVPAKIGSVVLASPDLDVDVFARQWTELGPDKPSFTIFVSQDDRALAVSRLVSGGVDRVGAIDPAAEPYKTKLEQAGITVIDLTSVKTGDSLKHGKFAESPEVVQLIGQRLVGGQTLTDSKVSLGEGIGMMVSGTATMMGKVAATTVTMPITMMEGRKPAPKGEALDVILKTPPTQSQ